MRFVNAHTGQETIISFLAAQGNDEVRLKIQEELKIGISDQILLWKKEDGTVEFVKNIFSVNTESGSIFCFIKTAIQRKLDALPCIKNERSSLNLQVLLQRTQIASKYCKQVRNILEAKDAVLSNFYSTQESILPSAQKRISDLTPLKELFTKIESNFDKALAELGSVELHATLVRDASVRQTLLSLFTESEKQFDRDNLKAAFDKLERDQDEIKTLLSNVASRIERFKQTPSVAEFAAAVQAIKCLEELESEIVDADARNTAGERLNKMNEMIMDQLDTCTKAKEQVPIIVFQVSEIEISVEKLRQKTLTYGHCIQQLKVKLERLGRVCEFKQSYEEYLDEVSHQLAFARETTKMAQELEKKTQASYRVLLESERSRRQRFFERHKVTLPKSFLKVVQSYIPSIHVNIPSQVELPPIWPDSAQDIEVKKQFDAEFAWVHGFEEELEKTVNEKRDLEVEIEKLSQQLQDCEKEVEALKNDLGAQSLKDDELDARMKQQRMEFERERCTLELHNSNLISELATFKMHATEEMKALERQLKESEDERNDLLERNKELEKELAAAKQRLLDCQNEITSTSQQFENERSSRKEDSRKIAELEKMIQGLRDNNLYQEHRIIESTKLLTTVKDRLRKSGIFVSESASDEEYRQLFRFDRRMFIALSQFREEERAIFVRLREGVYQAVHKGDPHHYLHEDTARGETASVLLCVLVCFEDAQAVEGNPIGLSAGTSYKKWTAGIVDRILI